MKRRFDFIVVTADGHVAIIAANSYAQTSGIDLAVSPLGRYRSLDKSS